ncbi:MAG TPA: hypothetical protein VH016_05935 [Actinomycetota bacterium]|nr:hypothetical protein [Actinomycetota bacterium]
MTDLLAAAAGFVWRTGRLIDRYRFAHLFQGGERGPVLAALAAYQNPDGGFGNALEPDLRGPGSQPEPVEVAFWVLDEVGAMDDPMVARACDWLATASTAEGGVPFVLPSALEYPRAPWWQTEPDPPAGLVPTAAIAGLLHKHRVDHPWLEGATAFTWRAVDAITETSPYEVRSVLPFLDHVPDRDRAEAAFRRIGGLTLEQGLVALDPAVTGDVHTPLDFAPSPDTMARRLFTDEVIEAHLDHLLASQRDDGGWTVNFPAWTEAAGLEWRAWATVHNLVVLRAYRRLPG